MRSVTRRGERATASWTVVAPHRARLSVNTAVCDPSKISQDWVEKGFHIHVDGVELTVSPDHLGGVMFQVWFSSTPTEDAARAIKTAKDDCLPNWDVRLRWIRDAQRAT